MNKNLSFLFFLISASLLFFCTEVERQTHFFSNQFSNKEDKVLSSVTGTLDRSKKQIMVHKIKTQSGLKIKVFITTNHETLPAGEFILDKAYDTSYEINKKVSNLFLADYDKDRIVDIIVPYKKFFFKNKIAVYSYSNRTKNFFLKH